MVKKVLIDFCICCARKFSGPLNWIGPQEALFSSYLFLFFSTRVSNVPHFLQEDIIVDDGVLFDLYSGNCFDKIMVLSNSRISVWEFSDKINCPWQMFVSTSVVSLFLFFLFFFFLQKCILCVCIYIYIHIYIYNYIYIRIYIYRKAPSRLRWCHVYIKASEINKPFYITW